MDRARSAVTTRLELGGQRAISTLLDWDERLVNRVDPPVERVLDPQLHPWSAELDASWRSVRAELDELVERGTRLPETSDLAGVDQGAVGSWTTYVLHWYGTWLPDHCARFPATTELLRRVPHLQIAGFTVLGPGTHVPRHQGPAKSLRWQMGVRVPDPPGSCRIRIGDDLVHWSDGLSVAFDDRTPHEAWNDSEHCRYNLFVQVAWPVEGWTGRAHRTIHRAFGTALRGIPRRVEELDRRLNPPSGMPAPD